MPPSGVVVNAELQLPIRLTSIEIVLADEVIKTAPSRVAAAELDGLRCAGLGARRWVLVSPRPGSRCRA
jgi:hypothetical protein